jgi:hypothetical protein
MGQHFAGIHALPSVPQLTDFDVFAAACQMMEDRSMTLPAGILLPEAEIARLCRRYQVKELAAEIWMRRRRQPRGHSGRISSFDR